jgi:hypothetical protein
MKRSIILTLLLLIALTLSAADAPAPPAEEPKAPSGYLETILKAPTPQEMKAAQKKISSELTTQYNEMLKWLATRVDKQRILERDGAEVLVIQLLSDVQWYGATDFFVSNITWHVPIPLTSNDDIAPWRYFPCAVALMTYKGCELKIAEAVLHAKRESVMQLLCVVLLEMQKDPAVVKKLLAFCAVDKPELKESLNNATKFIDGYDPGKWEPPFNLDLDTPPAEGGAIPPASEQPAPPPDTGNP